MKFMMKKTLSVIIALAMILVPMSVFAATGDPIAMPEDYIWSGDVVEVEAGATAYFEIGGPYGTYDFVVEGNGDYTVAICTEGSSEDFPYAEGVPVAAVDGVFSADITLYESTYGCGAFAITNNSTETGYYTCTIVYPEGSQENPKALNLVVGDTVTVTVPAGSQYYIAATLPVLEMEYQLTITGNTGFGVVSGYGMPTPDTDGVYTGTIAAYFGSANMAIVNNTESEQTYTLAIADTPKPLGSKFNPDELPMDTTTTKTLEGNEYWYTWTAAEDGSFTFTYENDLCADGWTYYIEHGDDVYYYSSGWYEYEYASYAFNVAAGDEVKVSVSIPTYMPEDEAYDVYTYAYGDVVFTTAFSTESIDDDDIGGGDIGGGDEENYVNNYESLMLGENMYVVDAGYQYTIYIFEPTEEGKYTFTSEDSVMGIVSYNGAWVTIEPSAETVNANEFTWECTGVGQSIWVAVMANTNVANITITREDRAPINEVPWTIYENVVTPEAFTFEGNADELAYVDVEDETVDTAVLGEDGYYHLNSADGEILYVSLDDELVSMLAAQSYGQLIYVEQDENLVVISKTDYNEAFAEYAACADSDTNLYPLTVDLMVMLKNVGAQQGWYLENGYAGTSEDAWMFLCYYVPADEDIPVDPDPIVPDPEIPDTGAEVFGVAFAMMATAAALGATVVTTKKSKRVK